METKLISVALVDAPSNAHRIDIDQPELNDLADSIRMHGLINPINVKAIGHRFEVIAGHRRLLAHQQLGHITIRATIMDTDEGNQHNAIQFAENFHRSDLSPMEEAGALSALFLDPAMTVNAAATLTRRSVDWINGRLNLLDLPDSLAALVHANTLAIASALALSEVTDVDHRNYLTTYTVAGGASAFTVRSWVETWKQEQIAYPDQPPSRLEPLQPGERAVIHLACYVCQVPTDHTRMQVVRICPACCSTINKVSL